MAKKPRPTWHRQADRKRKLVSVTISDEAREALDELAVRSGDSKSGVVERLILTARADRAARSGLAGVDQKGNVFPTNDAWERVSKAYPDISEAETFQRAQALTIAEIVHTAYGAPKRPGKPAAKKRSK